MGPSSPPLVTVVTPSRDQGRFIRETIESVLAQDYPRIEYLVMDGGSTDDTLAILRSYEGRLAWISAPDRGQASAINTGWRGGRGDILAWLNSDDTYRPGAVQAAVRALQADPEASAVYGEGYHVDEAGRTLARYPTEPFDMDRLKDRCFICQPTVFMRRSILERVGYLDESLEYCMDYDLWIRIARAGRFAYVPEYLAMSRLHAATKTLGRRCEVYAEIVSMIHRHFGHVPLSWVYAYAKAGAGDRVPQGLWPRARFLARLGLIAARAFLRYNRRVPVRELLRWRESWQPPRAAAVQKPEGGNRVSARDSDPTPQAKGRSRVL